MHNKFMYDQNRACVWTLGKLYRGETPKQGRRKEGEEGKECRDWTEGGKNEVGRMKVQFTLPSPGEHVDP